MLSSSSSPPLPPPSPVLSKATNRVLIRRTEFTGEKKIYTNTLVTLLRRSANHQKTFVANDGLFYFCSIFVFSLRRDVLSILKECNINI